MAAPQTEATTDPQSTIAALQQRLDAALSEKATLAEELAARDAALAQRNSEFGERIEQQSATVDVLKAMSASPDDPQPVFDLIVERARDLCDAHSAGLYGFDGTLVQLRAATGVENDPERRKAFTALYPRPATRDFHPGRAILDRQIVRIDDAETEPGLSPLYRRFTNRSGVAVPLLRGDVVVGALALGSRERGGFSDSQIELLKTFAEQAVIAITSAETYRALQTRTSDLQQSLEYQTATSDVLKVISRSTFDLQPVLTMVAETAARLCVADQAAIFRLKDDILHLAVNYGFPPEYKAYWDERGPVPFGKPMVTVLSRTIHERHSVHVHDVASVPGYPDQAIRLGKQRTSLGVRLLREGEPIGVILLARQRVEPFTDRQIELVSTFADQAVIAIENTRLLTEQREALEQQTATAQVLQVINASPGNLVPVFDAILVKAHNLCSADHGSLYITDGEAFRAVAVHGMPDAFGDLIRQPFRPGPNHPVRQLLAGTPFAVVHDATEVDDPIIQGSLKLAGMRSALFVPLRKDKLLLGYIVASSPERRVFTEKQVALLQNFASQAVIAMENARLITEQREALEQQTATAEVLQVINANPGDLTLVFEAILEKAHDLCDIAYGDLQLYDGEHLRSVAQRGVSAGFADRLRQGYRASDSPASRPLLAGDRFTHITDAASVDSMVFRSAVRLDGIRTVLFVPLRKEGSLLGMITSARREVRPFTEKEIALLENFSAQAVIAMENARLITEQREALEQQTATAEVLEVINSSPGNLAPVFNAMIDKAMRLCQAEFGGLLLRDGDVFRLFMGDGLGTEGQPFRPDPGSGLAQMVSGAPVVHIADVADTDEYRARVAPRVRLVEEFGARTTLFVALRKDDVLLGVLTIYRREVRPFTDKQIALVQSFAAQAVIAMENARLLEQLHARTDELAQRQEELRLTFDNMGDGVAMFDETPRLVAWNRKFQEIFNVPDALLDEHRTYAEYVRYLGTRGDFGPTVDLEEQIRRFTEIASEYHMYERVRPGGRVIEIRHNPVPGGGFVLIYADITERKRNEAEIRAARDAAEEASRTIEAAYRDLKAAQANLIQAEKMASLGQLTAGIAHEIKNPLNFVNNFAALSVDLLSELRETVAPGFAALTEKQRAEVDEVSAMLTGNLEKINEHGKRADGIVKAMLEHSRGSSGERRMVDLNALIDEALNLAYHGARAQDQSFNITLERNFGEAIAPIEVNPQDITRVFLNIFSNGFYAVTRRARGEGDAGFVPTLKVTTRDVGEAVEIRVRDNGTGIPADIRDKLFQPFFTTKPTGEGTGLGLSITYDIVTAQHGGNITVDSKVGEYSEFTIRLPRNP